MGRAASKLTKPVRTFNIENRAAKAIQNQTANPKAAPRHPSRKIQFHSFSMHPEYLEAQQIRNEALHENLKKIYVDTKDSPIEIKSAARPLPTSRKAIHDSDLGSMDIDYRIPEGKADLKTILEFIGQHQLEPTKASAHIIAEQHKLDEKEVENLLRHFKAFQLHIPQSMYKDNPKLKKIMAEQMNSASATLSQFRISSKEKQKQLEKGREEDLPIKT